MEQDNTLQMVAKLIGYAHKGNTYLMEYQPLKKEATDGNLSVLVPSSTLLEIFPAGLPAISDNYMITFTKDDKDAYLVSSFNLNSEVIPASEMAEFEELSEFNTKGQSTMQLAELKATREKELSAIENDHSLQEELARIRKEEAEKSKAAIQQRLQSAGIEAYFEDADVPTPKSNTSQSTQSVMQSRVTGD